MSKLVIHFGGSYIPIWVGSPSQNHLVAPPKLAAKAAGLNRIDLTWTNVGDGMGPILERSSDGEAGWSAITALEPGGKSYSDGNLAASIYYYRIKATTPSGESILSNVVGVATSGIAPEERTIGFALYPTATVVPGETTRIVFGLPLPEGLLTDLGQVRLLSDASERPIAVQALTPWRRIVDPAGTPQTLEGPSWRSVLIHCDATFPDAGGGIPGPIDLEVRLNQGVRVVADLIPGEVRSTWAVVNDPPHWPDPLPHPAFYESAQIEKFPVRDTRLFEPKAFAVFPVEFYSDCQLKDESLLPLGSHPDFRIWDDALPHFVRTLLDEVDPRVESLQRFLLDDSGNIRSAMTDAFTESGNPTQSKWTKVPGGGTWMTEMPSLRQSNPAAPAAESALIFKGTALNGSAAAGASQEAMARIKVDTWGGVGTLVGVKVKVAVPTDGTPVTGRGYSFGFTDAGTVGFRDDGVVMGPSYPFAWKPGKWYVFRLRHEDGTLRAKVWEDGTDQPRNWPCQWTRTGRSGYPALHIGGMDGAGTGTTGRCDWMRSPQLLKLDLVGEPYLYDRVTTLYQVALRVPDRDLRFKLLRDAHRLAQFYVGQLSEDATDIPSATSTRNGVGSFNPKNRDLWGNSTQNQRDPKYVYAEPAALDYWLTGDSNLPQKAVDAAENNWRWVYDRGIYTPGMNQWTERHTGFSFLNQLIAWELTGDQIYLDRLIAGDRTVSLWPNMLWMQETGAGGARLWPADAPAASKLIPGQPAGGLMHTAGEHGEGSGSTLMASPWMTSLIIDPIHRYHLRSHDPRVPQFVMRLADFCMAEGGISVRWSTYTPIDDSIRVQNLLPFYLAGIKLDGRTLTSAEHSGGQQADIEHTRDVAEILALAYRYAADAGMEEEASGYFRAFSDLMRAHFVEIRSWIRLSGPPNGMTMFRLSNDRKLGWWYRTSASIDALIGMKNRLKGTFHREGDPELYLTLEADKAPMVGEETTITATVHNPTDADAIDVLMHVNTYGEGASFDNVPGSGSSPGLVVRDGSASEVLGTVPAGATVRRAWRVSRGPDPTPPRPGRPIDPGVVVGVIGWAKEGDVKLTGSVNSAPAYDGTSWPPSYIAGYITSGTGGYYPRNNHSNMIIIER